MNMSTTPSRKLVLSTSNPFERQFGYYRAVRRGPFIFVSGTTALKLEDEDENERVAEHDDDLDDGRGTKKSKVHFPHSAYDQAVLVMRRCIDAVKRLGGKVGDVVRVRMFVANHDDCLAVGSAYKECFAADAPASSTEPVGARNKTDDGGRVLEVEIGAAATMIVVQNGFVDPDVLVEVEIDAVVI